MGRLEGKVAIVTGAGGDGMGRAAAVAFAAEGATVIGCDVNGEGVEKTAGIVRSAGGTMMTIQPLDILVEENVQKLVAFACEQAGGVDILYNNVNVAHVGFASTMGREEFDHTLTGAVTPGWMMAKYVQPAMAQRGGGSIINIASIAGTGPGTGLGGNANFVFAYGIGKAGVVRMTQLLAMDYARFGIRVNCISPGSISPGNRIAVGSDGTGPLYQGMLDSVLIKRSGRPEDVAQTAVFFASDESAYVTGQHLAVDGGWTVSGGLGGPDENMTQLMIEASAGLIPSLPPA